MDKVWGGEIENEWGGEMEKKWGREMEKEWGGEKSRRYDNMETGSRNDGTDSEGLGCEYVSQDLRIGGRELGKRSVRGMLSCLDRGKERKRKREEGSGVPNIIYT